MSSHNTSSPATVYLRDYQPPIYFIPQIHLDFDLYEDRTIVTATSQVEKSPKVMAGGALQLDGSQLQLLSIKINGQELKSTDYTLTPEILQIWKVPEKFELEIKTEIKPQDNKAFSGLYKTKKIFCTQMEAQGFRRVTYFMDRPDVLSKYTTTIRADKKKYPYLLSNGDAVRHADLPQGRHLVEWKDPFPKPCYLFALVAGDLALVKDTYKTKSGRKVDLEIFTDHGNESRCPHAMKSLKESMKWDEDTYGLEYDLNVYMIVAVEDFNMGAMENKGLNIFNSKYVLADTQSATDTEYMNIQSVIGHEYFHNWSGNRVTCRDWFQLSLKEGLTVFRDQEFSSDLHSRAVKRIEDVGALRTRQFPEDASGMAHPVRPPSYIAIDNFYTRTVYDKGAEVIRMLQTLLGRRTFIEGVKKYFKLHDGQAVTTDDFVKALEITAKKDLSQFKRWYEQAGTPTLSAKGSFDEGKQEFSLTLRQVCQNPVSKKFNEPYHLPVKIGLLNSKGEEFSLRLKKGHFASDNVLDLQLPEEEFVFSGISEAPVVSLLREFSAPVQLDFEQSEKDLLLLMEKDSDSYNRWEAAQRLFKSTILKAMDDIDGGQAPTISQKLIAAMGLSLQGEATTDRAFLARLLAPPSVSYLLQFCLPMRPALLEKAYNFFVLSVQKELKNQMLETYQKLDALKNMEEAEGLRVRALKQTLLTYITWGEDPGNTLLLKNAYLKAENMTDSLSALSLLAQKESSEADQALSSFYERWKNDSLVLNKWFTVQAQTLRKDALERVKKLHKHPHFDITNPNKLFALHYTFANNNPFRFHEKPEESYKFLAELIVEVDRTNPQVASRLATSFNDWTRWAPELKQVAKKQLQQMRDTPQLSKNVYEIVDRALQMEGGN
jgi:aminopeptidase N